MTSKKENVKQVVEERALFSSHNVHNSAVIRDRGYHMINLPKSNNVYMKYKLVGGGGGGGGGGSGGCSLTGSGTGGGGGSGGGDAEVVHSGEGTTHSMAEYIPVHDLCGDNESAVLGVYVGRGGDGGNGGKGVISTATVAADGLAGQDGNSGRPTFLFFSRYKSIPDQLETEMISVNQVSSAVFANLDHNYVSVVQAVGDSGIYDFARGGFGGKGGAPGSGTGNSAGGTGGAGVTSFYCHSSGGGGGGGSMLGLGGVAGPVAYTFSVTNRVVPHTTTQLERYLPFFHIQAFPAEAGNLVASGGAGYGGDGGHSNQNPNKKASRPTGYGGFGHDTKTDGIDFVDDPDPEPEIDSSSEDESDCLSDTDNYGLSLGGGGGAGSGIGLGRNGANIQFPRLEMCNCIEITRPGDGQCPPSRPQAPGAGGGGGSGGSGMVYQSEEPQKSGRGGSGSRGATGEVVLQFFTMAENGGFSPIPIPSNVRAL